MNLEKIRQKAFINELYKMSNSIDRDEIFNFIKKASYIDELRKLKNYGSGKSIIIKQASNEYYTPSKWEGISGFHKAVSEDPKKYHGNKIKGYVYGGAIPTIAGFGLMIKELKDESVKNPVIGMAKEDANKVMKSAVKKIQKKYTIPLAIASTIGSIVGGSLASRKYLKERGIKHKNIIGNYSFNQNVKEKYLNKEGNMNYLDTVKEAAYKDELEKIALRNPVAGYGIKGATVGAGVGSAGASALAFKLLSKVKANVPKTPIVAAAAIAGAIAGARVGGGIGAYMGGGVKGTAHLMEQYK